jgi:LmbE family N-acetylglucosaminyl deacetylase/8-oxo-dGTP pyrophosphatase MutT (NUDIX family)
MLREEMTQRRLLAIFAHPDDESFGPGGTLARYARQGVEVHVCTVTDGAAGANNQKAPAGETPPLARLRRGELECACQALGVHLHTLDYRDSGMEGAPDNGHPDSLYQANLDEVAHDLVRIMCQTRPHVVITHDPTGGYFHPDHIKVNHAVRRAWVSLGDAEVCARLRAEGYELWRPMRLYCTVIPRSALKWFLGIQRLLGRDPRHFGQNQDIDLTQVGVPDEQIHVWLDVRPYVAIKEQASACHRSQGGGGASRMLPAFLRHRFQRYEHFVQIEPPDVRPHSDLFEGLEKEQFLSHLSQVPDWFFNQSAVIPYRIHDGNIEVLLITSRKRKRWVIPKGVVEPGMSPADSAAHEAWEEAGLAGQVSNAPVGGYEYDKWGGTCQVEVYLLQVETVLEDWPESFRDRQWLSVEEAAGRVDEAELKQIIRALPAFLEEMDELG